MKTVGGWRGMVGMAALAAAVWGCEWQTGRSNDGGIGTSPSDGMTAVQQELRMSRDGAGTSQSETDGGSGLSFAFRHSDPEPIDHLELAQQRLAQGDRAGAMLEAEKALFDDPEDAEAALLLGRAARWSGNRQLALDALSHAASLGTSDPRPWIELARLALTDGRLDEAQQLVGRALQLDRTQAEAHNVLGRVWLARSHWDRAALSFGKALSLQPDDVHYRNNLGYTWLLKRDFNRAVEALLPLGERSGLPAFMINNLGLALEGAGRLGEATAAFERALETNPRYLKARLNLDRLVRVAQRDGVLDKPVAEPLAVPEDGSSGSGGSTLPPDESLPDDPDLILADPEVP